MEEKKTIKITCPNCNKTGNYAIKPNYCAFCGTIFPQEQSNNHNK